MYSSTMFRPAAEVVTPHPVQDLGLVPQSPAWSLRIMNRNSFEFGRRQARSPRRRAGHLVTVPRRAPGRRPRAGLRCRTVVTPGTARSNARKPQHYLVDAERLGDVVVAAAVNTGDGDSSTRVSPSCSSSTGRLGFSSRNLCAHRDRIYQKQQTSVEHEPRRVARRGPD